jgi:hypothetical protein
LITWRNPLQGSPIGCTTAEGLLATLSIPPYLYGGAVVPVDNFKIKFPNLFIPLYTKPALNLRRLIK